MPNLLPHRFRGTAALFELNAFACLDPVPSKSLEMLNCNPGKAQHSHKSWSSAQKKQQLSYPLKFTTDEGPVPSLMACCGIQQSKRKGCFGRSKNSVPHLATVQRITITWNHISVTLLLFVSVSHSAVFNNYLSGLS